MECRKLRQRCLNSSFCQEEKQFAIGAVFVARFGDGNILLNSAAETQAVSIIFADQLLLC